MMRPAGRASLLVAFYVLTSATTAYAECAWVLREHVTGVIDGNAKDFYLLRMADDTRDGCYRLADGQGVFPPCAPHARNNAFARSRHLLFAARRLPVHGLAAWAEVQRRGYEGLVAKDESSAYRTGRTRSWLKVKPPHANGAAGTVRARGCAST